MRWHRSPHGSARSPRLKRTRPRPRPATGVTGRGRGRGRSGCGAPQPAPQLDQGKGPFPSSQAPLIDFLRAEPALNFGTRLAAIWIFSPVCGLTPWRAPRSATENLPKPVMLISPPRFRVSSITLREASTAFVASPLDRPDSDATSSTNSDFVTFSSLRGVAGGFEANNGSGRRNGVFPLLERKLTHLAA